MPYGVIMKKLKRVHPPPRDRWRQQIYARAEESCAAELSSGSHSAAGARGQFGGVDASALLEGGCGVCGGVCC